MSDFCYVPVLAHTCLVSAAHVLPTCIAMGYAVIQALVSLLADLAVAHNGCAWPLVFELGLELSMRLTKLPSSCISFPVHLALNGQRSLLGAELLFFQCPSAPPPPFALE